MIPCVGGGEGEQTLYSFSLPPPPQPSLKRRKGSIIEKYRCCGKHELDATPNFRVPQSIAWKNVKLNNQRRAERNVNVLTGGCYFADMFTRVFREGNVMLQEVFEKENETSMKFCNACRNPGVMPRCILLFCFGFNEPEVKPWMHILPLVSGTAGDSFDEHKQ